MDPNEMNKAIIDEFRSNEGVVGGMFEGKPLLLLHHTGAKSGQERLNPLMYRRVGDRFIIFASKAGADDNPDWYHNVKANPNVTIEVGTDEIEVVAAEVTGDERDEIWEIQKREFQQFAEYEAGTSRKIPLVALERS